MQKRTGANKANIARCDQDRMIVATGYVWLFATPKSDHFRLLTFPSPHIPQIVNILAGAFPASRLWIKWLWEASEAHVLP